MQPVFAVIADDLSGGMNIGVEFATAGMKTVLAADRFETDASVLIVNTETRNELPDTAYEKVRRAAAALHPSSPQVVVKKIDSLLRGSIGREIEAVRDVFQFEKCLLVAASPKLGRKTLGGYHYIEQHLLETVRQQVDPSSQVAGSYVPTLVAGQTALTVTWIPIERIREGGEALRQHIEMAPSGILAADSAEQSDLNQVVAAAYQSGIRFFAGTYGLGEALSQLYTPPGKAVLIVVGSLSVAAYEQMDELREVLKCSSVRIDYPQDFLDQTASAFAAPYTARLQQALREDEFVLLQISALPEDVQQLWIWAEAQGLERQSVSDRIDALVHEIVRPVLDQVGAIVATGGATASSLFALLRADGLQLDEQEVLPGTPGARIVGGPYNGMPFIAKPGSQGGSDALIRLAQYVRRKRLT